jgi:hypothetical protein
LEAQPAAFTDSVSQNGFASAMSHCKYKVIPPRIGADERGSTTKKKGFISVNPRESAAKWFLQSLFQADVGDL